MCFKIFRKSRKERKAKKKNSLTTDSILGWNDNPDQSSSKPTDMSDEKRSNNTGREVIPEFKYLEDLIDYRLSKYFPIQGETRPQPVEYNINDWVLPLKGFVLENQLGQDAATLLLIGLAPHIHPAIFDTTIDNRLRGAVDFPKLGGVRGKNSRFFLPTGETALFLIGGEDFFERQLIQQLFGAENIFWEKKILWLEDMQNSEPAMHGRIVMSPDYVDLLTYGIHKSPQFSISFPAKKIAPFREKKERILTFNDLVIPEELSDQINELRNWLKYNDELMNRFEMKDRLRKGYRTLFYGPPGTGKTYTAEILGNELDKDVFKIDLSMVVSKYIGETEKNLELLFARAEDKGWILFFDEADALFGKRTNVRDAHDKYANQEVSYLLQRIEDYNGLVILATNMKNNIDDAFIRRFNSILKFPFPDPQQRALIWKRKLPKNAEFRKKTIMGNPSFIKEEPVDIPEAVKKYELTGGNIINVVHYASIKAVEALHIKEKELTLVNTIEHDDPDCRGREKPGLIIYLSDILDGIKWEMIKEGKPFSL